MSERISYAKRTCTRLGIAAALTLAAPACGAPKSSPEHSATIPAGKGAELVHNVHDDLENIAAQAGEMQKTGAHGPSDEVATVVKWPGKAPEGLPTPPGFENEAISCARTEIGRGNRTVIDVMECKTPQGIISTSGTLNLTQPGDAYNNTYTFNVGLENRAHQAKWVGNSNNNGGTLSPESDIAALAPQVRTQLATVACATIPNFPCQPAQ